MITSRLSVQTKFIRFYPDTTKSDDYQEVLTHRLRSLMVGGGIAIKLNILDSRSKIAEVEIDYRTLDPDAGYCGIGATTYSALPSFSSIIADINTVAQNVT